MITISEIARLAGTTVRAVRLYHQRGLLPEPPREENGYRSYGPEDLLALLRIRRMRELGFSLSRIAELVTGAPDELRAALLALDADLAAQRRAIAERRRMLATVLAMPGDPTLPPALATLIESARSAGYSESALRDERDAALIFLALEPQALDDLVRFYEAVLADETGRLRSATEDFEALAGAGADDPRVEEVAARLLEATGAILETVPELTGAAAAPVVLPPVAEELFGRFNRARTSPAQQRVNGIVAERISARYGLGAPGS